MPTAKQRSIASLAIAGGIALAFMNERIYLALYSLAVWSLPCWHVIVVVGVLSCLIAGVMMFTSAKFSGKRIVMITGLFTGVLSVFVLELAPIFRWASHLN
jgi:uncharacterized membrane protein HdeD (DUF308 family)